MREKLDTSTWVRYVKKLREKKIFLYKKILCKKESRLQKESHGSYLTQMIYLYNKCNLIFK